jgi:serine/threonine-protein phosphatase 6 regulatory subunit 3
MGHLMLISEDVITAMSRFPPDLRLNIIQYAPEPEWEQFVTGRYNETKQEDNRLLGGGKPVVKSNVPRAVTEWKVDEGEMESSATRSESGMSSAFRKSNSASVKQTADFGPPPISMDDEDDTDTPSRAPQVSFFVAQFSSLLTCYTSVRSIPGPGDGRCFRPIWRRRGRR